jgi:phosphate-selective porin OprO/OprP
VTPKSEFNWSEGTWGALELAVRVSRITADAAAFPAFADPAASVSGISATTIGANWYLNRNVKVSANYSYGRFDGAASNPNSDEDERALSSRVQLRF